MGMKLTILAILASTGVTLAVPAAADHVRPFPDPSIIKVPPAQYDPRLKGPPPGTSVYYIPHSKMYAVCSNGGRNANIKPGVLACAFPKSRRIYLPNGMTTALRNAVLRHERGHIWGWRHTGGEAQAVHGLHENDHHEAHE